MCFQKTQLTPSISDCIPPEKAAQLIYISYFNKNQLTQPGFFFFFRFMKMLNAILIIMIRQEILSKTKFLWEIMSASRRRLCADA